MKLDEIKVNLVSIVAGAAVGLGGLAAGVYAANHSADSAHKDAVLALDAARYRAEISDLRRVLDRAEVTLSAAREELLDARYRWDRRDVFSRPDRVRSANTRRRLALRMISSREGLSVRIGRWATATRTYTDALQKITELGKDLVDAGPTTPDQIGRWNGGSRQVDVYRDRFYKEAYALARARLQAPAG